MTLSVVKLKQKFIKLKIIKIKLKIIYNSIKWILHVYEYMWWNTFITWHIKSITLKISFVQWSRRRSTIKKWNKYHNPILLQVIIGLLSPDRFLSQKVAKRVLNLVVSFARFLHYTKQRHHFVKARHTPRNPRRNVLLCSAGLHFIHRNCVIELWLCVSLRTSCVNEWILSTRTISYIRFVLWFLLTDFCYLSRCKQNR